MMIKVNINKNALPQGSNCEPHSVYSCSRSAIPPAFVRSSEAKNFIGHMVWSVKNHSHCKESEYDHSVSLLKTGLPDPACEIVERVEAFQLKNQGVEAPQLDITRAIESCSSSRSFIMDLIRKICLYLGICLTPEEVVLRKLQSGLDNGFCYGIDLAIAYEIGSNPNASSSEIIKAIDPNKVVLFQVLKDLNSQVNQEMVYINGLLHHKNDSDLADCPSHLKNCSKEELQARFQEGISLLKKIKEMFKIGSPFTSTQETICSTATDARNFLSTSTEDGPFLVNLIPNDGGAGHSLMLDLKNNRFFDQNGGFYQYDSKEALLDAFFNRIESVYSDLQSGGIDLIAFKKP